MTMPRCIAMWHMPTGCRITMVLLFVLALTSRTSSQCTLDWASGFAQRGMSGPVSALHVCDLGDGPHLYAGGGFVRQNGQYVNRIAKWSGSNWDSLGGGANGDVSALVSADLGSGLALHAAGFFNQIGGVPAPGVAKWTGTGWVPMNAPDNGGATGGMRVMTQGGVTTIYGITFGKFCSTSGPSTWLTNTTLFNGGEFRAIEIFDDGTGPHVFVAGTFTSIGGITCNRIAKFTGTGWTPLGTGLNDTVNALAVYDDGTGPALYAGGSFTVAGGNTAKRLAKWNGSTWSEVGGGIASGYVNSISAKDYGAGMALLVGGFFSNVGQAPGTSANFLARWNGSNWAPFGSGLMPFAVSPAPAAYAVLDEGMGPNLIIGGPFAGAGGEAMNFIARWDGAAWHPMPGGNGVNYGGDKEVTSTVVWDDGNGPALYCAGNFQSAGNAVANNVVRFDGSHWSALGAGTNGGINALAVFDDGTGPALYAGGGFTQAGGVPALNIAKWNGTQWSSLGLGLSGGQVYTLEPITAGPYAGTLAAGGTFNLANGYTAPHIAFWTGSSWLSTWTTTQTLPLLLELTAIASFDDGSGPAIYAGGHALSVSACWKFDGAVWSQIGDHGWWIRDFQVFDDGSGPQLYGGGSTTIYPTSLSFGRLTGSAFTAVPGAPVTTTIRSLHVHQDESGTALYLGGETSIPGQGPAYLRRWDGSSYTSLGAGVGGLPTTNQGIYPRVDSLASFDSGMGPALYAAGNFTQAGSFESGLVARWAANRPTLTFSQAAPGAGVVITNTGLLPGHDYHNVFSLELCGPVGTGPYLGLCASDPASLLVQFDLPIGTVPFHFVQSAASQSFGPYGVPAGIVFDGVAFDFTAGMLGCASPVRRYLVQ